MAVIVQCNHASCPDMIHEPVEAAADDEAAPLLAAAVLAGSLRPRPVVSDVVSLLLSPVGCKSCIGIFGKVLKNFPANVGPAIRATKITSMTKYRMANRITLRFRNFDCLSE